MVKVLMQVFELSVWNFEIFNEILLRITVANSSRVTSVACYSAGFYRAMFTVTVLCTLVCMQLLFYSSYIQQTFVQYSSVSLELVPYKKDF